LPMVKLFISLILTGAALSVHAQLTAEQLIDRSIQYHDPQGLLEQAETTLHFIESRPNSSDSKTTVVLNPWKEEFKLIRKAEEKEIVTSLNEGVYSYTVAGVSPTPKEVSSFRLDDRRSDVMRTYYHYLWYMPMKLLDPSTIIDPDTKQTDFFGRQALQIRVTYDPTVGKDIWYFYFDPDSYALIGYRFYHNESVNDGEYIIFEGEEVHQSVRIPKSRTWYTHKDDRLLGTDVLHRFTVQ